MASKPTKKQVQTLARLEELRLIRVGMDDRIVLGDIGYAIAYHNLTIAELRAALDEHGPAPSSSEGSETPVSLSDEAPEYGLSPRLEGLMSKPPIRNLSVRADNALRNANLRSLATLRAFLVDDPDGLLRVRDCGPRIAAFIKQRIGFESPGSMPPSEGSEDTARLDWLDAEARANQQWNVTTRAGLISFQPAHYVTRIERASLREAIDAARSTGIHT